MMRLVWTFALSICIYCCWHVKHLDKVRRFLMKYSYNKRNKQWLTWLGSVYNNNNNNNQWFISYWSKKLDLIFISHFTSFAAVQLADHVVLHLIQQSQPISNFLNEHMSTVGSWMVCCCKNYRTTFNVLHFVNVTKVS